MLDWLTVLRNLVGPPLAGVTDRSNREAFSSLETLGWVQISLGCLQRGMSTEDGDEKTCYVYSPSAAGAGRSPKDSGHHGCRPSLNPAWSITPHRDRYFLEDSESVSKTFLLLLRGLFFRLHFAFVSICRFREAHFFYCTCVYITQWHIPTRGTDTFSVLASSFCLTLWHPFDTSLTAPCSAGAHRAGTHNYACKSRDFKTFSQLTQTSTSLHVLCDSSRVACMVSFLENHGTSSFQRLLSLLLSHPGTEHHRVMPPIIRLTRTPLAPSQDRKQPPARPQGQVSMAG